MRPLFCLFVPALALLTACSGLDAPARSDGVFAPCCQGLGSCIPGALASSELAGRLGREQCAQDLLCAPSAWLADPGYVPASCHAAGGLEGRCLPGCLPELAARAEKLSQESCGQGMLCLPCFDPLSGADTQACRFADDRPAEPAQPFAQCCGEAGRCVPGEILLQSLSLTDMRRLAVDSCAAGDGLCVPDRWLEQPGQLAEVCRTLGDREGRCLSSCLPDVAAQAQRLARATCAESELCAPCMDPLTGTDTGVCRFGQDAPREAERPFEYCCGGVGRCLPRELLAQSVSPADSQRLGPDTCSEDETESCVPERWLTGTPSPASCRAAGDQEGRCLPSCLPELAAQGDRLAQRSCQPDERCVPCYDPLTGKDSEACRIGSDTPKEPVRLFERCCGGNGAQLGTCLPVELLSAEQLDNLPIDSCSRPGTRCAPTELVAAPYQLNSCTSRPFAAAAQPGLCLPECFVSPGIRFFVPRTSCAAPRRCVPCSGFGPEQIGCP